MRHGEVGAIRWSLEQEQEQSRLRGVQVYSVIFRRFVRCQRAFGRLVILTLKFSVLSALLVARDGPRRARKSDPIIARMTHVSTFAFGGVGFALAISDGEKDYRVILSRSSADTEFETIFVLGNAEAKCYALVGLRQTNSKRFEVLAASLESSRILVRVMRGCVEFGCPMPEITERIRSGLYLGRLTHDLVPPPGPSRDQDAVSESNVDNVLNLNSGRPNPMLSR